MVSNLNIPVKLRLRHFWTTLYYQYGLNETTESIIESIRQCRTRKRRGNERRMERKEERKDNKEAKRRERKG
jgi:hypothetical protein